MRFQILKDRYMLLCRLQHGQVLFAITTFNWGLQVVGLRGPASISKKAYEGL